MSKIPKLIINLTNNKIKYDIKNIPIIEIEDTDVPISPVPMPIPIIQDLSPNKIHPLPLTFPNNIKFVCYKCNELINIINKKIYKDKYYCEKCYIYITLNNVNIDETEEEETEEEETEEEEIEEDEEETEEEEIEEEEEEEETEEDEEEEETEEDEEEEETEEDEEETEEEENEEDEEIEEENNENKEDDKKNDCNDCNDNDNDNIFKSNYNDFINSIVNNLNKIESLKLGSDKTQSNKRLKFNNITITNNKKIDNDDNDEEYNKLDYEWLGSEIKNIDDLIRIGNTYNPKKRKRYNLNLKSLNKLVEPLIELNNMIGMTEIKKIIFDQIIYYLQKLDDKNVDMLHTVIVGPPGVGKTQLTHIIAKIYNKLGFLKTDNVICAKRDDLIGEYIGQTAPKTRKLLEKALGGVLLLDEVYSLSPNSEKDFAREAIDMINMYLSEHSHDLVCVIAGYKKPTYENFLAYNQGLARRFTHHFEIKGYNAEELTLIFKKYVEEQKWSLTSPNNLIIPIIEKNLQIFPNFGGDMTTLFSCCKKTHSKRLLFIPTENELLDNKKKITILDIEQGIKLFKDIKEKSKSEEDDKSMYVNMYS